MIPIPNSSLQLFFLQKSSKQDIYWKNSNVHLRFPGWIISFFPRSFSQQLTLPHSVKLPAVTHVLLFRTSSKMTPHLCIINLNYFREKNNCILLKLQPNLTIKDRRIFGTNSDRNIDFSFVCLKKVKLDKK